MKHIRLQFANGAVWGIPLHDIANNRSKYYAERDKSTTYKEEYDYVMNDDYEGLDWFSNNMDWEDIQGVAFEIKPPKLFVPREHIYDDGTEISIVLK